MEESEAVDSSRPVACARYHVADMDCAEECEALRRVLHARKGVVSIDFDILRARMDVMYRPDRTTPREILGAASATGYRIRPWEAGVEFRELSRGRVAGTALSALGVAAGIGWHAARSGLTVAIGAAEGSAPDWTAKSAFALAIAAGFSLIAGRVIAAIRSARADMNVLVTLAVAGAVGLGDWVEAATVSFLFALAHLLDQWSLERARRAIRALMAMTPPTARRWNADRNGAWDEVPVGAIEPGDRVLVYASERIPVDGIVLVGDASVDQGPITGESQPAGKTAGDEVYAATIPVDGSIEIRVTRRSDDTIVAGILRMIEEGRARKAPAEQFVESFARWYTPAVIGLAALCAVVPPAAGLRPWTSAFYESLVLLVIACPCALVISTPVTLISALAAAARAGVLIKGGRYLEACARIRAIAFDKTGTLTTGHPTLERVVPLADADPTELLAWASGLESRSHHPVARAIRAAAKEQGLTGIRATFDRQLGGMGVEGTVEGRALWLGGSRLVSLKTRDERSSSDAMAGLAGGGRTVVALGDGDRVLGWFVLSDTPRPEAAPTITALRALGIRHVELLTGDHAESADRIARIVGADHCLSGALPEHKVARIDELRSTIGPVAMVGDGVNDGPALAAADAGVAMAAIGTAAAIETADIALMTDDLTRIPWLVVHARRAMRIVHQNVAVALGIKACFLILTFSGRATLWSAIAADMGASLLVILNGLRARRAPSDSDAARRAF